MTKAIDAAARVFGMIDSNKSSESSFQKTLANNIDKDFNKDGEINISGVCFNYTSRSNVSIFTGIYLSINLSINLYNSIINLNLSISINLSL
jgi:hypothetical protein